MKNVWRWIPYGASICVGLFLSYVLAANLLIGTPLLRSIINDGPDRVVVEYRAAWSFWPGRVRVLGLRIRDRAIPTEWSVALDEGRGSIGLLDLLRRRFHPSHVRGTGLVIRVRSRLLPGEATPERLAFLPPIPGFSDPPLREPGQTASPASGREWTIHLDDVAIDAVREIWVDDYRYVGGATLIGGFLLHPKRSFEVFPTSLEVRGGVLKLRGDTMVGAPSARIHALVERYELQGASASAVLRYMTGTGRVRGRVESVRFLNELLHVPAYLQLERGAGNLVAELSLDQGLGKGSLDFSASGVEARMPDTVMSGAARGRVLLARLDLRSGRADFAGSHLELQEVLVKTGTETPWVWRARLELPAGQLRTEPPRVFHAQVGLRAPNARPFYRLLNLQWPKWAERLLKLAELEATADLAIGKSFVTIESLDAVGGNFHILGHYQYRNASRGSGDGAFLIAAGPIALGVGISDGEKNLKLVRARHWYRRQTAESGKG